MAKTRLNHSPERFFYRGNELQDLVQYEQTLEDVKKVVEQIEAGEAERKNEPISPKVKKLTASNIHADHRSRMRKRFVNEGLENFYDHEILELLLYYGIPRKDTNPIAHQLIQSFGNFPGVLEAGYDELLNVPGMTAGAATLLRMIAPVFQRYLERKNREAFRMQTLGDIAQYMFPKYMGAKNEIVYCLAMDSTDRLIACEKISEGTLDASVVSIRVITEFAFRVQAMSIVLCHNHPNGVVHPSQHDLKTTQNLNRALSGVGIYLRDHLIFAGDRYISLRNYNGFEPSGKTTAL